MQIYGKLNIVVIHGVIFRILHKCTILVKCFHSAITTYVHGVEVCTLSYFGTPYTSTSGLLALAFVFSGAVKPVIFMCIIYP